MQTHQLLEILGYFPLEGKDYRFQTIGQGLINDTFLVSGDGKSEYILQRLNTTVFQNTNALMGNLEKLLSYLHAPDYASLVLVRTRDGDRFARVGKSGCWRLVTYLWGSTTYDTTESTEVAYEAGRIIGRFHCLLNAAPIEEFEDTLPRFHDLVLRNDQFQNARQSASDERLARAENVLGMADKLLERNLPLPFQPGKLPLRICHNDTKLNNILFDMASGHAMCLIDLDTAMKGYLMYDIGDAVRTIANTAAEDEPDPQKIKFSKPLFESFVDGLWSSGLEMTDEEVASLPYGAIYMPLLHGIRALTDFLSGDIYYKVSYPDQNLDRSASLLTFAMRAEAQLDYMRRQVCERRPL